MLRSLKNRKAQSTAEYAILIALVIGVVIAMQTYVKRGIQGRYKDEAQNYASNVTGDANWAALNPVNVTAAAHNQYEVGTISSQSTQDIVTDDSLSTMEKGGTVVRSSNYTTASTIGDQQTQSYNKTGGGNE